METILLEVLIFIGTSMAGGLTWDLIKEKGGRLVEAFKKRFTEGKHFQDDEQAEKFLQYISSREPLNRRQPLLDVWSCYDYCTGREPSDAFKADFQDWVREFGPNIGQLAESARSEVGLIIQKQINKDNAQTVNIGKQYNYGENNGNPKAGQ